MVVLAARVLRRDDAIVAAGPHQTRGSSGRSTAIMQLGTILAGMCAGADLHVSDGLESSSIPRQASSTRVSPSSLAC